MKVKTRWLKKNIWSALVGLLLGALSATVMAAQTCDPDQLSNTPTKRFVIHDDATVTDRVTGLVWTRCSVGQSWSEGRCLDSSIKQLRSWFDWQGAHDYVANIDQKWPGQNSWAVPVTGVSSGEELKVWRMPSIQELRTIIDRHCQDPAINLEVFPGAPSWGFWSASEWSDNSDYAWQVNFQTGETAAHLKNGVSYHLRLVSGNPIQTDKKRLPEDQARLARWDDGIHDTDNPGLALLEHPEDATAHFPRDTRDAVDWAQALLEGTITPRAGKDDEAAMVVWDQDLIFKDTATMPHVRFPHKMHSMWLACKNCHEEIFATRFGASEISMGSIYRGEHCGVCHGKVAFSPHNCERCHSVMHEGATTKWW